MTETATCIFRTEYSGTERRPTFYWTSQSAPPGGRRLRLCGRLSARSGRSLSQVPDVEDGNSCTRRAHSVCCCFEEERKEEGICCYLPPQKILSSFICFGGFFWNRTGPKLSCRVFLVNCFKCSEIGKRRTIILIGRPIWILRRDMAAASDWSVYGRG